MVGSQIQCIRRSHSFSVGQGSRIIPSADSRTFHVSHHPTPSPSSVFEHVWTTRLAGQQLQKAIEGVEDSEEAGNDHHRRNHRQRVGISCGRRLPWKCHSHLTPGGSGESKSVGVPSHWVRKKPRELHPLIPTMVRPCNRWTCRGTGGRLHGLHQAE